jgi:hypothetical protein
LNQILATSQIHVCTMARRQKDNFRIQVRQAKYS